MKGTQKFFLIVALASAVLCPLSFILLLDKYTRTSEFSPQFSGFVFASLGTLLYCLMILVALWFCFVVLKRRSSLLFDFRTLKLLFIFCSVVCMAYFAAGFVVFQGMYVENTIFYLTSRFSAYFFSIFFSLLSYLLILSKKNIRASMFILLVPSAVILFEKLLFGRITVLDISFNALYFVLWTGFACQIKGNLKFPYRNENSKNMRLYPNEEK